MRSMTRRPRGQVRAARRNNTPGTLYLYGLRYDANTAGIDNKRIYVYGAPVRGTVVADSPQNQIILNQTGVPILRKDRTGVATSVNTDNGNAFPIQTTFTPDMDATRIKQITNNAFSDLKAILRLGHDVVWPSDGLLNQQNLVRLVGTDFFENQISDLKKAAKDVVNVEPTHQLPSLTGGPPQVPYRKQIYPGQPSISAFRPPEPFGLTRGHLPALTSLITSADTGPTAVILPMNVASMRMASIASIVAANWPTYNNLVQQIATEGKALDPRLMTKLFRPNLDESALGKFLRENFVIDSLGMTRFIDSNVKNTKLLALVQELAWDVATTSPQIDKLPDIKQRHFVGTKGYMPLGLGAEKAAITLDIPIGKSKEISYGVLDIAEKVDLLQVANRAENHEFLAPIVSLAQQQQQNKHTFHVVGTSGLRSNGYSLLPTSEQTALGLLQIALRSGLADFSSDEPKFRDDAKMVFGLPGPEAVDAGQRTNAGEFATVFMSTVHVYEGFSTGSNYDTVTLSLTYDPDGSISSGVLSLTPAIKELKAIATTLKRAVVQPDGNIAIFPKGMRGGLLIPRSQGFEVILYEPHLTANLDETAVRLVQTTQLQNMLEQGIDLFQNKIADYPESALTFMAMLGGELGKRAGRLANLIKSLRSLYGGSEIADDVPNLADLLEPMFNRGMEALQKEPRDAENPDMGNQADALRRELEKFSRNLTVTDLVDTKLFFSGWAGLVPPERRVSDPSQLEEEGQFVLTYNPREVYQFKENRIQNISAHVYTWTKMLGEEIARARLFTSVMQKFTEQAGELAADFIQPLMSTVNNVKLEIRGDYAIKNNDLVETSDEMDQPRYFAPAASFYGDPKALREVAAYRQDLARSVTQGLRAPTLVMLEQASNTSTRLRPLARRIAAAERAYNVSIRRDVYERAIQQNADVNREIDERQEETRRGVLDDADAEIVERAVGAPKVRTDIPLMPYIAQTGNLAASPVRNMVVAVYAPLNPVNIAYMRSRHEALLQQGKPGDVAYLSYLRHHKHEQDSQVAALREIQNLPPLIDSVRQRKEISFSPPQGRKSIEDQVQAMMKLGIIQSEGGATEDERKEYEKIFRELHPKRANVIRVLRPKDVSDRVIEANRFTKEKVERHPDWTFVYGTDVDNLRAAGRTDERLLSGDALGLPNVLPFAIENEIIRAVQRGGNVGLGYTVNVCPECEAPAGTLCWDMDAESPRKQKIGLPPHEPRITGVGSPAEIEAGGAYLKMMLAIQGANTALMMAERSVRMAEQTGQRAGFEDAKQKLSAVKNSHTALIKEIEADFDDIIASVAKKHNADKQELIQTVETRFGPENTIRVATNRLRDVQKENVRKILAARAANQDIVLQDTLGLVDLDKEGHSAANETRVTLDTVKYGLLAQQKANPSRSRRNSNGATVEPFAEVGLFYQTTFSSRELVAKLKEKKTAHDKALVERAKRGGGRKTVNFAPYLMADELNVLSDNEREADQKYIIAPAHVAQRLDLAPDEEVNAPLTGTSFVVKYLGDMNLSAFKRAGGKFLGGEEKSRVAAGWERVSDREFAIFEIVENASAEQPRVLQRDIGLTETDKAALQKVTAKRIAQGHVILPRGTVVKLGESKYARSLGVMNYPQLANILAVQASDPTSRALDAQKAWQQATGIITPLRNDQEMQDFIAGRRELCVYEISDNVPEAMAIDELKGFNQAQTLLQIVLEDAGVIDPLPGMESSLADIWAFLTILKSTKGEEKGALLEADSTTNDMRNFAKITDNEGARLEAPFSVAGTVEVNLSSLANAAPSASRPLPVADNVGFLNFVLDVPTAKKVYIPLTGVLKDAASSLSVGIYGLRTLNLPVKANTALVNQLVLAGWSNQANKLVSIALMPTSRANALSFSALLDTKAFQSSLERTVMGLFSKGQALTNDVIAKAAYYNVFAALAKGGRVTIASVAIESTERRTNVKVRRAGSELVTATSSYRMLPTASDLDGSIFDVAGKIASAVADQREAHPNNPKWWATALIDLVLSKKLEFVVISKELANTHGIVDNGTYLMQVGPTLFKVVASKDNKSYRLTFTEHTAGEDPKVMSLFQRMADQGIKMPDPILTWDQISQQIAEQDLPNHEEKRKAIRIVMARDKLRYLEGLKEARKAFLVKIAGEGRGNINTPYRHAPTYGYLQSQLASRAEEGNLMTEQERSEGTALRTSAVNEFAGNYLDRLTRANPKHRRSARLPRRNPLKSDDEVNAVIDYASGKEDNDIYKRAEDAIRTLTTGEKKPESWEVNKDVLRSYFPRQGVERPSAWVPSRLREGLSPGSNKDLIARMHRVRPDESAGKDASGAPVPYSSVARTLATGQTPFYREDDGVKWIGQNAEMSVDEAKTILAQQRGKVEYRGVEGRPTIQAASAICKTLRRRKLSNFEIPVSVFGALKKGTGDKPSNSLLILMSPRVMGDEPLRVPRVMTWRRLDHIDCDMVGKDPGDLVELLGKSVQSALYWVAEHTKRRGNVTVFIGRVGDPSIQVVWKPGEPITIETVTKNLKDTNRSIQLEEARLTEDVARYDQAERELQIGNHKAAKASTQSAGPKAQQARPTTETQRPVEPEQTLESPQGGVFTDSPSAFGTEQPSEPIKDRFMSAEPTKVDAPHKISDQIKDAAAQAMQGTPQVIEVKWLRHEPVALVTIDGDNFLFRREIKENSDTYAMTYVE